MTRITLVLDRDFGRQSEPERRLGEAFWLIESDANRALAKRLWNMGGYDGNSAVFDATPSSSATEQAASILPTIFLHHPDWTEIEVIGAPFTEEMRLALVDHCLGFSGTPEGFKIAPTS